MTTTNTLNVDVKFTINGVEATQALATLTMQAKKLEDAVKAVVGTLEDLSSKLEESDLAGE